MEAPTSEAVDGIAVYLAQLQAAALPDPAERRSIRKKTRTSLRTMAALVGVTPMTVKRWEEGVEPTTDRAIRYRRVLDALSQVGK
ncbi:helix-turn-helix domain-containing protein [Streptomyces rishiriensis]|uniref:helix-turn-helix domain-containing protein n=1 Tax=Streptomyces rishiriensis TaxID=68264 RepID=UPI0033E75A53